MNIGIRTQYGLVGVVLFVSITLLIGCSSDGGGRDEKRYFVGGEVNGLSGTLVLQNNGGDDLTISSDGIFEFDTPLPDQATYEVTISTCPSSQNCFCANPSGVINGADNYNITIDCVNKTWNHPDSLNDNINPNGIWAYDPKIAMDNNGNAIIVWEQSVGSNQQVFMSEYRQGIWTHPDDLNDRISPNGNSARSPQVAMDANGNAIITWYQSIGVFPQIFISEYRNDVWTHPAGINDGINPEGYSAYRPQVSMDNNGNAIIVWVQSDASDYLILKSDYRYGIWTHPKSINHKINPEGPPVIEPPHCAMDDNGNAIIVWTQSDGPNFSAIYKSEYRIGAWIHPGDIDHNISPDGLGASAPQVAMDNSGNAIITWRQYDGGSRQIFMSEYRHGEWTHPHSLKYSISPNGQDVYAPRVAMDNNGNAIIVWYQNDGSHRQIFMSEHRNGVWTHPHSLNDNISPDGQDAYAPRVAMDDNGNAIIVWCQNDGSHDQIFISEHRNGVWTHPHSLNDNISPDGQDAGHSWVAMDDNGNAIIVWEQDDGTYDKIFVSEFR